MPSHSKRLLSELGMKSYLSSQELSETATQYLHQRRELMDRYFLTVRFLIGLAVAGYLAIDTMMTAQATPQAAFLAVTSYLLANAGIWLVCRSYGCEHTRWIFAGMDVAYILLLRHVFQFEAITDPNVTMAGLLAFGLVAYTFYSDPRLTASFVFGAMLSVGGSLWIEAAHTFASDASSATVNYHALRATLLMGYLAAFGLLSLGLSLFARQQTLNYLEEQKQRIEESVRAAVERSRREHVEELNHLKEEFITVIGHELRTPISPLRSSLELLENDLNGNPDALDTLELAQEATGQLHHLVQDYLQLAELLMSDDEVPEPLNVHMGSLMEALMEGRDQDHVELEGLEALTVAANPHLLSGALAALLRRADLVTPAHQMVEIHGYTEDSEVVVEVRDPTSHFDASINERLDDPFAFSEERAYYSPNSGLELTLARHALQRIGGHLHVENNREGGTTARCQLPPERPELEWLDDEQLRFRLRMLKLA